MYLWPGLTALPMGYRARGGQGWDGKGEGKDEGGEGKGKEEERRGREPLTKFWLRASAMHFGVT